jgi:hypothetical protein
MTPPPRRPKGRAVPPQRPALPVASEDDPFDDFGLIALRFAPPLGLTDFRRVAEAHGLAYAPSEHEPQLFRTPDGVEVAYGYEGITPLPPHVAELLICGADGPNAPAVLALAEALLAAWPRARWEADPGFAVILAQRAPGRRAKRRRPGR